MLTNHAHRGIRRSLACVSILALSSLAAPDVGVAQAATAACSGNWYPDGGIYSGRFLPSTAEHTFTELIVRTVFTFTDSELESLKCTGSATLEVDMQVLGNTVKGGVRDWRSSLPADYLDTEAFDSGDKRTLTVGTTHVDQLVANQEYYVEITVAEFAVDPGNANAKLNLDFQRGHWEDKTSPKEVTSCLSHGSSDPAWCVFPDESAPMVDALGSSPVLNLESSYPFLDSAIWGSYRRNELNPGDRINSGDRLYSPNSLNTVVMQPDGNLVEYIPGGEQVWSSQTSVPESIAIAQEDGNLVIVAPGNRPIWDTGTHQTGTVFQLQDDRNWVGYAPGHVTIWSNEIAGH